MSFHELLQAIAISISYDKEQFSKLLLEQKGKGSALISLISTMHENRNDFGDGMVMSGVEDDRRFMITEIGNNRQDSIMNLQCGWDMSAY